MIRGALILTTVIQVQELLVLTQHPPDISI